MNFKRALKTAVLCGAAVCFFAGVYAAAEKIKSSSVFTVKSVEIKGVVNADRKKLASLGGKLVGMNIFDSDLEKVLTTDDPWVRKLVAKRELPSGVTVSVFEEKALVYYKAAGKCYVLTGGGSALPSSCDGVNVRFGGKANLENAKKFVSIREDNPILKNVEIVLKEHDFTAFVDGQLLICPYDAKVFAKNYEAYAGAVKRRYKRVEYVDLTVNEKIFVKGDRSDSGQG